MLSKSKVINFSVGMGLTIVAIVVGIFVGTFAYNSSPNSNLTTNSIKNVIGTGINKIPKAYVVQSGSMEPAIKTASLVISAPRSNYSQGDIVTFKRNPDSKETVTHRIVFKLYPTLNGEPTYMTAGDANEEFDNFEISNSQIIGKVVFSVPYVGYVVDFAKKPQGFILLVIVPATLIIYEELKFMARELKKRFSKLRKKKSTQKNELISLPKTLIQNQPSQSFLVRRLSMLIPAFGAFFIFVSFSSSYLFDREISQNNLLQVYAESPEPSPSPTPTPTESPVKNVVINEVYYDVDVGHGSDADNEWIEIYNPTSQSVDISGWTITDNNTSDTIPNSSLIPANGFAIVTNSPSTWDYWTIPTSAIKIALNSSLGNGLANAGDSLTLTNTLAVAEDEISWGSNISVLDPSLPNVSEGHSLERNPDGIDTNTATDFIHNELPTPGN